MRRGEKYCYCRNMTKRKRFLALTPLFSMAWAGGGIAETWGNGLFPLKKRYSPFIFQKERLDKTFANGVNTKLTKKT